jgi:tRNA pseudouridine38-40 synthase
MSHWKIILTYDGTPFNGWQIQPNLPTVQGTLAQAIHHITGESVLPQGSGRTDAGVHALAQVASLSLSVPIPAPNLHRALNRALPSSIRVISIEQVPEDFHARHSALRKIYEYRISTADICSPMLANYVWNYHLPLDLSALQSAATHILGTHDFTSFSASDPDLTTRNAQNEQPLISTESVGASTEPVGATEPVGSTGLTESGGASTIVISTADTHAFVSIGAEKPASLPQQLPDPDSVVAAPPPSEKTAIRTIYHSAWHQHGDLLIYRITGSGFLHHMVRNLVGSFVEVGSGRIPADSIPAILAAHDRSAAGPTAPARGLFLVEVEY